MFHESASEHDVGQDHDAALQGDFKVWGIALHL